MTTTLSRSDWRVPNVRSHAEAARLIRTWHYSGSCPNTSTYRHGLYRADTLLHGEPYGVALWIPPTRTTAESLAGEQWQGVLSLSRLVVAPEVPRNGASFLMAGSMRAIDRDRWPVLVTYADTNQGHTGAIYRATNWRCDGEVPAGDVWQDADGRLCGRKRGRFTYTVAEMEAQGLTRRPAAPKIRFVHDPSGLTSLEH